MLDCTKRNLILSAKLNYILAIHVHDSLWPPLLNIAKYVKFGAVY